MLSRYVFSSFLCSPQPRPFPLTPFSFHVQHQNYRILKEEEEKRQANMERAREEYSREEEEEEEDGNEEE